ncbi:DUF4844 domain-containing protein [Chryseobacterium luteum]|uniref:Uncharacterized protein n=1 Tax=Chryseobacterium luteum TaxID=421531 RepID=A0A085YZL8_9FLAO|nr:DUF4844 domain-containing protein [Chryseobacterium luteum]KFE97631.1 hypothetical protein IX38_20410 [Chryseobacterium luteum]
MKNQTEEIINLNRTKLNEDLKKLENEKTITQSESKQIHERLNSDLDYYLKHQDIDFAGLEKMFFETTKSFENIKVNQSIFLMIMSTYGNITSQIAMRQFPMKQEDYAIQTQLNNVMNNWFDNYQNDSEKIADLISQINKQKQTKIYSDISSSEYDDIISTVNSIKNDTAISDDELKKILTEGMLKYCNKSNESNLAILNIYGGIDRIKKLGIDKQLSDIYQKKCTKPKELSYSEIKQQVSSRFKMLLTEDMITQQNFENYTKTIIQDVEFCEKNTDKTQIKAQLLSSLKKLKKAELDTEDREAITDWYFILSQKSEVDIKSDLNKWLYDFDPN